MMEKIAYNLGRNDEEPNIALAVQLCKSKEIFENIETIVEAYEKGSVITRDSSITVFAELAKSDKHYEKIMLKKIIEHLMACRPKEVG